MFFCKEEEVTGKHVKCRFGNILFANIPVFCGKCILWEIYNNERMDFFFFFYESCSRDLEHMLSNVKLQRKKKKASTKNNNVYC